MSDLAERIRDHYDSIATPVTLDEIIGDRPGAAPGVLLDGSVDSAVEPVGAQADVPRDDDLMVDYLQQRPDESDALAERKGWRGVVLAVAATILVVVGVVVVADSNSGDLLTDQPSITTEPVETPSAADPVAPPGVADPPVDAGDDGPGIESQPFLEGLAHANDVQFDPSGGLFVSETWGERVVRVAILPDGSASEPVVVASDIDDAEGLALDGNGVLYISGSDSVYRVVDAITTRFVAGFNDPEGLAIDASGDLYVADDAASGIRISKVSILDGDNVGMVTEVAIVPGESASDIEFGPTGELFVANRVDEVWAISFADDGSVTSRPYALIPGGPVGLVFDPAGTLYVGTNHRGVVWSVEPEGAPTIIAAASPMEGLALDASGTLYLAGENEVWSISANELNGWSPEPEDIPGCEIPAGWAQVCDAESFGGAVMYAVTAGGPGLVAVGGESLDYYTRDGILDEGGYGGQTPIGAADAAVWTSRDGFSWSRVPHDEAVFGGIGSQQMFSVSAGGPGLVAVGRDGPAVDGEGHAAVWTSPDGLAWTRVPHDEAVFGGPGEQRMVSVTVGGPGLVAVGFDRTAGYDEGDAAVWTSPDGLAWSRVPHDEAVFGGENVQMMLSVTAGGPGRVAVGSDGHHVFSSFEDRRMDESAADAAVWTSPDGLTWIRVPHDEEAFGGPDEQSMRSVTVGGPGLVAVGFECGHLDDLARCSDAAVWTSPDGSSWLRVPDDESIFSTSGDQGDWNEAMLSVTAGGPGLVAVGFDLVTDCGFDSAVWTSPDGHTWSRVPDERGCLVPVPGPVDRMLSVTVGPSGLVAVGEEHYVLAAAVWNG